MENLFENWNIEGKPNNNLEDDSKNLLCIWAYAAIKAFTIGVGYNLHATIHEKTVHWQIVDI